MKKLDGLSIYVSPEMRSLGYGNVTFKATVEYRKGDSSFTEEYLLGNDTLNLDSLFRQVKLKVYKLEQDENFGKITSLQG